MGRYELVWESWDGQRWEFTTYDWAAGITADGIDGLMTDPDDVVSTAVGELGQVLTAQGAPPMSGSLRFAVRGDQSRSADEVWSDLRRSFHHRHYGTLILRGALLGSLSCQLRRDGVIAAPSVDPSSEDVILNVQVPLISDDAVWWTLPEVEGGGNSPSSVTVTNSGDTVVWPSIVWSGRGGQVTMPSGAVFTLPPAPGGQVRRMDLSVWESNAVWDEDGNLDRSLWGMVRGAPSEPVPEGQERTYTVPAGAAVESTMGVFDPWR